MVPLSTARTAAAASRAIAELLGLGEVRLARPLDRHLVAGRAVVGRHRIEDAMQFGV